MIYGELLPFDSDDSVLSLLLFYLNLWQVIDSSIQRKQNRFLFFLFPFNHKKCCKNVVMNSKKPKLKVFHSNVLDRKVNHYLIPSKSQQHAAAAAASIHTQATAFCAFSWPYTHSWCIQILRLIIIKMQLITVLILMLRCGSLCLAMPDVYTLCTECFCHLLFKCSSCT